MDTLPEVETAASPAKLSESDIVGLKYFYQLLPLLKRLRGEQKRGPVPTLFGTLFAQGL